MQQKLKRELIADGICQKVIENNPYGFILRPDLKEKTGGMLNGAYHKNLDYQGKGIEDRFKIGNTTAYPIDAVVAFIKKKIISQNTKTPPSPSIVKTGQGLKE
ncbi:MAG: hypothetical protein B6I20_13775 [Bacteroidetes bacterium 4572_117]|nr:MAG: hypothetical protein B6I20_13775 [Bacteroidetes bacterium 4572_117]